VYGRAAVGLAIVAGVLTSCGGARLAQQPAELIGFDTYMAPGDAFEATRLVKLDPETLRPVNRRGLKLGDAAAGGVLGPDGRTYAVGGINYGELILVDLKRLKRVVTIAVQPSHGAEDIEVDVAAWPRPHCLIAVVGPAPGKYLMPHLLAIIDPLRHRVRRITALHGTALAWVRGDGGRTAILTTNGPGRIAPAQLVVVGPNGNIRTVEIPGITAGVGAVRNIGIDRFPGLASDGRHAFLVSGQRIAAVDLTTLAVAYHEVPELLASRFPPPAPFQPGSSGLYRASYRSARWLGHSKLLVTGSDAEPMPHGYLERTIPIEAAVVDTKSWRLSRPFHGATSVQAAFGLWFGRGTEKGPSLIAFRNNGTVLYRKTQANLWWRIVAGKLLAGNPDGSWLAELDPQTGRPVRVLGRSALWPPDVMAWRPPRRG
jgi:hypothetical protein